MEPVRLVRAPDGRLVAILGEAHLKLARAAELGRDVVGSFELRGVETFQRRRVLLGRTLGVVIEAPRRLLRVLSLGAIKGSTITDAKQLPSGHTVELERAARVPVGLHVASVYMTAYFVVALLAMLAPLVAVVLPLLAMSIMLVAFAMQLHLALLVPGILLRRHAWSWVLHPFLGILTPRDKLMAEGAARMLADHPTEPVAVRVMGRAHVQGVARPLVERHGFARLDPPPVIREGA